MQCTVSIGTNGFALSGPTFRLIVPVNSNHKTERLPSKHLTLLGLLLCSLVRYLCRRWSLGGPLQVGKLRLRDDNGVA